MRSTVAITLLLFLLVPASADARRKATKQEKRQIAQVFNAPPKCGKFFVSTVNEKWATYQFNPAKFDVSPCEQVAADGVAIVRRRNADDWRFVTAGSAFDCPVPDTPRKVAEDLRVECR